MADKEMTFWDHLDELRKVLFHIAIVLFLLMVVFFCLKNPLFEVVFAPLSSDFALFRGLDWLLALFGSGIEPFDIEVINIDMAAQFFTHLKVAMYAALIVGMPYFFYELWSFIAPALYPHEKKAVKGTFGFAGILFYMGVLCGYYMVLPLTVKFLGTYQVSPDIPHQISLGSYIGMFVSLILIMGIVFEMPVLAMLLSKFGIINKELLRKYRRHAIVVRVILAAVITPSGDAFTMFFVACPLYMLYEFSIMVCKSEKEQNGELDDEPHGDGPEPESEAPVKDEQLSENEPAEETSPKATTSEKAPSEEPSKEAPSEDTLSESAEKPLSAAEKAYTDNPYAEEYSYFFNKDKQ